MYREALRGKDVSRRPVSLALSILSMASGVGALVLYVVALSNHRYFKIHYYHAGADACFFRALGALTFAFAFYCYWWILGYLSICFTDSRTGLKVLTVNSCVSTLAFPVLYAFYLNAIPPGYLV